MPFEIKRSKYSISIQLKHELQKSARVQCTLGSVICSWRMSIRPFECFGMKSIRKWSAVALEQTVKCVSSCTPYGRVSYWEWAYQCWKYIQSIIMVFCTQNNYDKDFFSIFNKKRNEQNLNRNLETSSQHPIICPSTLTFSLPILALRQSNRIRLQLQVAFQFYATFHLCMVNG